MLHKRHFFWWVVFGLALLLGVGLRLTFALDSTEDYDEDDYLAAARAFYESDGLTDYPNVDNNTEHPPLVKIFYSWTLDPAEIDQIPRNVPRSSLNDLPPNSLRAARLQAVLVSGLALVLVGLFSPLAMLGLAVSSLHVHYGSLAYLDPFAVLGVTVAGLAFVYSLQANDRARWWAFGLSATAFGAAVAAKYPFALVGVVLIVFALVYRHYKLWHLVAWGLWAIAIFFILNPYLWVDPVDRVYGQLSYHDEYTERYAAPHRYDKPLNYLTTHADHIVHWRSHPAFILSDWVLFLAAVPGTIVLLQRKSFFGWWLVGGLLFLSMWQTQWRQHLLLIIVPYCYSAAVGLTWAWGRLRAQLRTAA